MTGVDMMAGKRVDLIARAVCREGCAVFGDPPCYELPGPWPLTDGACSCWQTATDLEAALRALAVDAA